MPRLRFSLRRFFLVLFVACLIGSNIFTAFENRRLRQLNVKLQVELGLFVVGDPNKLHAIAVETHEQLTWRWRLHVPTGKTFEYGIATKDIPSLGVAGHGSGVLPTNGDFTVTAAIRRDRLDRWILSFSMPSESISMPVSDEHLQWIVDGPGASEDEAGIGETTRVVDAGEPMVLLRRRALEHLGLGTYMTPQEPCDGVMIWIIEEKRVP